MNKILLTLILLAAPLLSHAGGLLTFDPSSNRTLTVAQVSGATCGTIQSQTSTGAPTYGTFGAAAGNAYLAGTFTAGANANIKTLYLWLRDQGTPTGYSATVSLCTTSSGAPTTTCTAFDSGISGVLTGTLVKTKFNIAAGYDITAPGVYAIVVHAAQTDSSNYYQFGFDGTITTNSVKSAPDGMTWTNVDSTAVIAYEVSSCLE